MKFFTRLFLRNPSPPPNSHSEFGVPSPQRGEGVGSVAPADCAIWHDISRALNQSPRPSGEKVRVRGLALSKSAGEGTER